MGFNPLLVEGPAWETLTMASGRSAAEALRHDAPSISPFSRAIVPTACTFHSFKHLPLPRRTATTSTLPPHCDEPPPCLSPLAAHPHLPPPPPVSLHPHITVPGPRSRPYARRLA